MGIATPLGLVYHVGIRRTQRERTMTTPEDNTPENGFSEPDWAAEGFVNGQPAWATFYPDSDFWVDDDEPMFQVKYPQD